DLLVTAGGVAAPNPLLGGTPELTALATRINGIPDAAQRATTLAAYQWNNAEQQPWIDDMKTLIESGLSGKHSFFLNKPRWNWLGASVAVKLDVGKRAQAA
ncbi:flagellar motor protein MotB, partial [Aromatoleum toluclasticum]|nr:flagellar motor protein MotB [Aromatoleum toluclasticum]